MSKPLDFTGREIKVGNTCVYPVRRRSQMWLQRMTVTQIEPDGGGYKLRGYNNVGRKVTVQNLETTIVIDQPLASGKEGVPSHSTTSGAEPAAMSMKRCSRSRKRRSTKPRSARNAARRRSASS